MGGIVLDANKVKSYVLPNLTKSINTMQDAYNTSQSLRNSLPSGFSYRSTVNDIVTQIYNIKREISDVKTIIDLKVEKVKKIEKTNDNRSQKISKIATSISLAIKSGKISASSSIVKSIVAVLISAKNKLNNDQITNSSAFYSIFKDQIGFNKNLINTMFKEKTKTLTPKEQLEYQMKFYKKSNINIEDFIKEINKVGYIGDIEQQMIDKNGNNIFNNQVYTEIVQDGIKYYFKNGKCVRIEFSTGLIAQVKYVNDEISKIEYTHGIPPKNISVFGEYNKSTNQFGGDQASLYKNNYDFLQDPIALKIVREAFPNRTLEEYGLYFKKITQTGCGYTAMVNSIFTKFEGREDEFEQKFGFPMYKVSSIGEIDYNYEYLILDSFTQIWKDSKEYSFDQIVDSARNSSEGDGAVTKEKAKVSTGTGANEVELFEKYLKDKYNIDSDFKLVNSYSKTDSTLSLVVPTMYLADNFNKKSAIKELIKKYNENKSLILVASQFDLYTLDGKLGKEDVGVHAMTITKITEKGEIIVSSWGRQYIVDLSSASRIGYISTNYK